MRTTNTLDDDLLAKATAAAWRTAQRCWGCCKTCLRPWRPRVPKCWASSSGTACTVGASVGLTDAHLLAAVALTDGASLWTRDKHLRAAAEALGCAWLAADREGSGAH